MTAQRFNGGGTATTWQPIETAPKHGQIILFSPTFGVFEGEWCKFDDKWVLANDYSDGFGLPNVNNATHWMPLPEPPLGKDLR